MAPTGMVSLCVVALAACAFAASEHVGMLGDGIQTGSNSSSNILSVINETLNSIDCVAQIITDMQDPLEAMDDDGRGILNLVSELYTQFSSCSSSSYTCLLAVLLEATTYLKEIKIDLKEIKQLANELKGDIFYCFNSTSTNSSLYFYTF